jgi:phosphatidylserine/phosphatidylglycerophosphate/cardiolipin synthase-like enzyme
MDRRPASIAEHCAPRVVRGLGLLVAGLLMLFLGGCASLPPPTGRADSQAIAASGHTALGTTAAAAMRRLQAQGTSGVLAMPHPVMALDARLTLIALAQESLDLQYYHLADDSVGHQVLRALRDAAQRGVRVRLLIDDFHTAGMDRQLLALAAHDHVQVRLFNPFAAGRDSAANRWLQLAGDFSRLNYRMHNKLFIADGAMAIVGGRNLADAYFQRDPGANFIDFDVLALGAVVPELAHIFDQYWNSNQAYDVAAVAHDDDSLAQRSAQFDERVPVAAPPSGPPPAFRGTLPPRFTTLLDEQLPGLIGAEASALADTPDKQARGGGYAGTTTARVVQAFRESRSELMLYSPYFIPGETGMAGLREARSYGIAVRVITNALSATDEPLASVAYERYRVPMLQIGVELYELSPLQMQRDDTLRRAFGRSRAQLHAKLALIDRRNVIVGSLNLDQRSATTNTEMVLVIRSPELARQILAWFNSAERADVKGSYQVLLKPDGKSLQWVALLGGGRSEVLDEEPEFDPWLRMRLWLLSLVVPESWL